MRDNNVYVKETTTNGKTIYRPFGRRYDERYLPDGIWYCHHEPGISSTTNVDHYIAGLYKVGDAELPDLPKLCGIHSYIEYLLQDKSFREIMDNHSYTWTELISTIVSAIFRLNKTILENYDKERANK